MHRARKRERSERPGGVIPRICRSDRPGLEDRIRGRETPAQHRPSPGRRRPDQLLDPARRVSSLQTLVTTRHVLPAATRVGYRDMRGRCLLLLAGLPVVAAWVLLFVLITMSFPRSAPPAVQTSGTGTSTPAHRLGLPGQNPYASGRTTTTGQLACRTQCSPTDPIIALATAPRPRWPTTSSSAVAAELHSTSPG